MRGMLSYVAMIIKLRHFPFSNAELPFCLTSHVICLQYFSASSGH